MTTKTDENGNVRHYNDAGELHRDQTGDTWLVTPKAESDKP